MSDCQKSTPPPLQFSSPTTKNSLYFTFLLIKSHAYIKFLPFETKHICLVSSLLKIYQEKLNLCAFFNHLSFACLPTSLWGCGHDVQIWYFFVCKTCISIFTTNKSRSFGIG